MSPYQIDFRGEWTLDERRIVTEAIVEVEMQSRSPGSESRPKRWICQHHPEPELVFFAHHVRRNTVLRATSAEDLAQEIRRWGRDLDPSPASD